MQEISSQCVKLSVQQSFGHFIVMSQDTSSSITVPLNGEGRSLNCSSLFGRVIVPSSIIIFFPQIGQIMSSELSVLPFFNLKIEVIRFAIWFIKLVKIFLGC